MLSNPDRVQFAINDAPKCADCIFISHQSGEIGHCFLMDVSVKPHVTTCPNQTPKMHCDRHPGEEQFNIEESCKWCDYSVDLVASDCQFDERKKALRLLMGRHFMLTHPDKVGSVISTFSSSFKALAAAMVDATRRMAQWGRNAGRVAGELQKELKELDK